MTDQPSTTLTIFDPVELQVLKSNDIPQMFAMLHRLNQQLLGAPRATRKKLKVKQSMMDHAIKYLERAKQQLIRTASPRRKSADDYQVVVKAARDRVPSRGRCAQCGEPVLVSQPRSKLSKCVYVKVECAFDQCLDRKACYVHKSCEDKFKARIHVRSSEVGGVSGQEEDLTTLAATELCHRRLAPPVLDVLDTNPRSRSPKRHVSFADQVEYRYASGLTSPALSEADKWSRSPVSPVLERSRALRRQLKPELERHEYPPQHPQLKRREAQDKASNKHINNILRCSRDSDYRVEDDKEGMDGWLELDSSRRNTF